MQRSFAVNCIDVELGVRMFRRLVSLPHSYFGVCRVGNSSQNIHQFPTGQALTICLDVIFASVFVAVMWVYS